MTIGFIGMNICATASISPNSSLVAKSLEKCTLSRSLIIGISAFTTSLGILLIDGAGGPIYEKDKRNPFYLTLCFEAAFVLVTLILACCK